MKPTVRPINPCFSSGPCAKRPGWSPAVLSRAVLGRSHRSAAGKGRIAEALDRTRRLLGLPDNYLLGVVPGSDTGAMEMALWSLLGERGVDVAVWDSFSAGWARDIITELDLPDVRVLEAPYGALPQLDIVDPDRDTVFVWNGTTSGVRVPDAAWISPSRTALTICDATSAVFAMDLPWDRLDVTTWSWQKCLGGEAGHGMIVLSPRAVARLESHTPAWPVPKIFRLTRDTGQADSRQLIRGIFDGATINTPSMLCVEDWLDALDWAAGVGGLEGLVVRSQANLTAIEDWVGAAADFAFLAAEPAHRSSTSVCLRITEPGFASLAESAQRDRVKRLAALLEDEGVAFDIAGYRDAPPGLRLWAGPTVETTDLERLFPWLDWALTHSAD